MRRVSKAVHRSDTVLGIWVTRVSERAQEPQRFCIVLPLPNSSSQIQHLGWIESWPPQQSWHPTNLDPTDCSRLVQRDPKDDDWSKEITSHVAGEFRVVVQF